MVVETNPRVSRSEPEPSRETLPLTRAGSGIHLSETYTKIAGIEGVAGLPFNRDATIFDTSSRAFKVSIKAVRYAMLGSSFDQEIVDTAFGYEHESETEENKIVVLEFRKDSLQFVNSNLNIAFGLEFNPPEGHAFGLNLAERTKEDYRDLHLLNRAKQKINQQFYILREVERKPKWIPYEPEKGVYGRINDPDNQDYIQYDVGNAEKFLSAVSYLIKNSLLEYDQDTDQNFKDKYPDWKRDDLEDQILTPNAMNIIKFLTAA